MEKQFYHLGRKTKEYPRTCKADRQPHSHNTHTHTHTHILAHTGHKTPQSTHSTKHETSTNSSLCDDKTAYSTPHYRRSQSVDGVHPGGEESFQRTLAVKQQPGVSRRPPVGGSSPRKNTDFMIFFLNVTERSCSILDQWLLRTVPQGKEESRFFSFISTERL